MRSCVNWVGVTLEKNTISSGDIKCLCYILIHTNKECQKIIKWKIFKDIYTIAIKQMPYLVFALSCDIK